MKNPNPQNGGMRLPPPVVEQGMQPQGVPQPIAPNMAPPAMDPGMSPGGQPVPTMAPSQQMAPAPQMPPMPTLQGQSAAGAAHPVGSASVNLAADPTNDLIEKEWVSKAKQIVEQTRDDPYRQSEGLTAVKVDYMKKRYNKTIKQK
mgnify:FL=1